MNERGSHYLTPLRFSHREAKSCRSSPIKSILTSRHHSSSSSLSTFRQWTERSSRYNVRKKEVEKRQIIDLLRTIRAEAEFFDKKQKNQQASKNQYLEMEKQRVKERRQKYKEEEEKAQKRAAEKKARTLKEEAENKRRLLEFWKRQEAITKRQNELRAKTLFHTQEKLRQLKDKEHKRRAKAEREEDEKYKQMEQRKIELEKKKKEMDEDLMRKREMKKRQRHRKIEMQLQKQQELKHKRDSEKAEQVRRMRNNLEKAEARRNLMEIKRQEDRIKQSVARHSKLAAGIKRVKVKEQTDYTMKIKSIEEREKAQKRHIEEVKKAREEQRKATIEAARYWKKHQKAAVDKSKKEDDQYVAYLEQRYKDRMKTADMIIEERKRYRSQYQIDCANESKRKQKTKKLLQVLQSGQLSKSQLDAIGLDLDDPQAWANLDVDLIFDVANGKKIKHSKRMPTISEDFEMTIPSESTKEQETSTDEQKYESMYEEFFDKKKAKRSIPLIKIKTPSQEYVSSDDGNAKQLSDNEYSGDCKKKGKKKKKKKTEPQPPNVNNSHPK